ncbi:MAG: hypothetical protein WKG01_22465 [Kofleriaceae bacterium]
MGGTFADRDRSLESTREDMQVQPAVGKRTLTENEPAQRTGPQVQANQTGATPFESPRTVELLGGPPSPDFTWALSHDRGPIKFKGSIKLDPIDNGLVQLKDDRNKLQLAPVSVQMEKGKADIGIALLKESFYLGEPPWPFQGIRPEIQTKVLDAKLSEDPSKLKLLSIAFVVKGVLADESLVPEPFRGRYKIAVDFSVEHAVTVTDLSLLSKLGSLVDDALAKGAELLKWEDQLKSASKLVDDIKARTTVLDDLVKRSKVVNGRLVRPAGYQQAATELKQLTSMLLQEESKVRLAEKVLPGLHKAFSAMHDKWLSALSKMSPLLARFRGELVEKICTRLVAVFGSKLVTRLHPFLLIAGAVLDLMYIVKFLIDWKRGKLKYVGGDGDYEPSLLDWESAPDGKGGGTGTSETAPTEVSPNRQKLAALGGPRARLADVLLREGLDKTMEPRHFDRLLAILQSHDITPDDVDAIITRLTVGMAADAALDALDAYLRETKPPSTTSKSKTPTETYGDRERNGQGKGKVKGTGDGGGGGSKQRKIGGGYLGADDGGVFAPTSVGGLDLKVSYGTYAVYLPKDGAAIRVPGTYRKRNDGSYEFVPREPGVRVVYNRKGEKIGEVLVKPRYVM